MNRHQALFDYRDAERRARAAVDVATGTVALGRPSDDFRDLSGATEALAWAAGAIELQFAWMVESARATGGEPDPCCWALALARLAKHPSWSRDRAIGDASLRQATEDAIARGAAVWSARAAIADLAAATEDAARSGLASDGAARYAFDTFVALDEYGAFDPAFTLRDAMAGDVWLLEGNGSPDDLEEVTRELALHRHGYLPPVSELAAGHRILVCTDSGQRSADAIASSLTWSDGVAAWRRERWRRGDPGLARIEFPLPRRAPPCDAVLGLWPSHGVGRPAPTGSELLDEARRMPDGSRRARAYRERVTAVGTGSEWAEAHLELAAIAYSFGESERQLAHATCVAESPDRARAPAPLVAAAEIVAAEARDALRQPVDRELLADAVERCVGADVAKHRADGLQHLAGIAFEQMEDAAALAAAERAIGIWLSLDRRARAGLVLERVAKVMIERGQRASAHAYLTRAIEQFSRVTDLSWPRHRIAKLEALRATLA